MARKSNAPTRAKDEPGRLDVRRRPNEDDASAIAREALRPSIHAAVTAREYGKAIGDLKLMGLVDALGEQIATVNKGDLRRAEAMLIAQAHSLDMIFNNLAQRAIRSEYMDNLDRYLRLALRAQSQCRATLETLAVIKNPMPVAFVQQANIANGPQQVNNAVVPTAGEPRARETEKPQNELLEARNEEWVDTRAQGTAGGTHPNVGAMEEVDGSKNCNRQGEIIAERVQRR